MIFNFYSVAKKDHGSKVAQSSFSYQNDTSKSLRGNASSLQAGIRQRREYLRRPLWTDIDSRHFSPRECLVSYLALETAEVIAGVKPANLVSIPNRPLPCGRNHYSLWKALGHEVVDATHLQAYELKDRNNSVLVLFYQADALAELLATSAVRIMLHRAGYSGQMDIHALLDKLATRMNSGTFPHEIGIFLGYPLKDVAGFMGLARIAFTCQGPWKIYGAPDASLQLAETFRWCRSRMADALTKCSSPFECLGKSISEGAFFCCVAENDYQLQHIGHQFTPTKTSEKEVMAQCR